MKPSKNYYTLIYIDLSNGLYLWGSTYKTHWDKLLILHKRAIRIVAGVMHLGIFSLFQRFHILPLGNISFCLWQFMNSKQTNKQTKNSTRANCRWINPKLNCPSLWKVGNQKLMSMHITEIQIKLSTAFQALRPIFKPHSCFAWRGLTFTLCVRLVCLSVCKICPKY